MNVTLPPPPIRTLIPPMRSRAFVPLLPLLIVAALLSGCSSVAYYSQAVSGHVKLMLAREPIDEVLSDEQTPEELRQKLRTLIEARRFAVERLHLPDNDSYDTFVATNRDAVTWNVVAAEEFSVQPLTWCFPVAGCVNYRGYFDRADADRYAAELSEQQYDVTVGGASAYSTLGWFDDPVLDTMLRGSDIRFVGTLFHELAHQVLYVKDDSNFNEAYATFVEQLGVQLWLEEHDETERIAAYRASRERVVDFVNLLGQTRKALSLLYDTAQPVQTMREAKAQVFEDMRENYASLKQQWGGYSGYDSWFRRELNNARLVSVSTYRQYVPAFHALYVEAGEDLRTFYRMADELGKQPRAQRRERLDALLAQSRSLDTL